MDPTQYRPLLRTNPGALPETFETPFTSSGIQVNLAQGGSDYIQADQEYLVFIKVPTEEVLVYAEPVTHTSSSYTIEL